MSLNPVLLADESQGKPAPLQALVDIVLDPPAAFMAIAAGASWIPPVFVLTALRVAQDFIFYHPSREPVKVLLTILFDAASVCLPLAIISLCLRLVVALLNAHPLPGRLFPLVAYCAMVDQLLVWTAAMIHRAVHTGRVVTPRDQPYTNLAWLVREEEHRVLHHVLQAFDAGTAVFLVLLAFGLPYVTRTLNRSTAAGVVFGGWFAWLLITTAIKVFVS